MGGLSYCPSLTFEQIFLVPILRLLHSSAKYRPCLHIYLVPPWTLLDISAAHRLYDSITSLEISLYRHIITSMDISPSIGRSRRPRASTGGEDQNWTAAKCLRLLRPIHARIGNLRQLAAESAITVRETKPAKPTFLRTGGKHSLSDDEWDPSASKRSKVTYAQRRRKAARHSDPGQTRDFQVPDAPKMARPAPRGPNTPGKFLITTPLIRKIKGSVISPHASSAESPTRQGETGLGASTKPGLSYLQHDIQNLKSIRAADQVRHEEALLQALDALFRHAASRATGTAPRSLVAMCLRQAPRQLRRIEEWDAQEAERRGEKSALTVSEAMPEMYQNMESLGGDAGWRPLRHMVRAHAVTSICEATSEGLVDISLTRLLVKVCIHWNCYDEAATLLESLIVQKYPQEDTQDDIPSPTRKLIEPVACFVDFCTQHARWSTLFGLLTRLISENRISGEWLCTKTFEPVWAGLSRRLVNGGRLCSWTLNFFHAAIWSLTYFPSAAAVESPARSGRGLKQAAPWQMFVSTVGAVTAMALMALGRDGAGDGVGDDGICRSVLYALDGSLAKLSVGRRSRNLQYRSLLEIGICAVSGTGNQNDARASLPTGTNHARGAPANRRLYEGAVSLICSIAQHCSRGSPLAPHQHLLAICDSMARVSLAGRSMADVRRDGAFMLAQRTCDMRDLAFAERSLPAMEGASAGGSAGSTSSGGDDTDGEGGTLYSGWKWDEGISEWVVRTPVRASVPAPARALKPCREVLALKTRFGRQATAPPPDRQTRNAKRSPPRVRPTRRTRSVESDDSTSEDEMAQEEWRGRPAASRLGPRVGARPGARARTRTRRKLVRRISSLGGAESSDDELLL